MDLPSNNHNNGANNKKMKQEIHDLSSDAIVGPTRKKGRKMNHEQNGCARRQEGKRYKHEKLNNCAGKSQ